MSTIDISLLNPEQRAAVVHRAAPLLLLAGAGSGKTRVITYRIAHLIAEGVSPHAILGVTFTNKAAEEMRSRVRDMVREPPDAAQSVTLSTFHSLGVRILREFGSRVGVPASFTILDSEDQQQALRAVLEEARVDPKLVDPALVGNIISRAKNDGDTADDLRRRARSYKEKVIADLLEAYTKSLKPLAALDFDDLLRLPVQLLSEHEDVRRTLQGRYQHILVDEYQDSNRIQLRLVQLLAGAGTNLVVVGDDDQSIYGWRGACMDNILDFERHFPGAMSMKLTQNYRSTGRVLALANAIISGAPGRRPKELWTRGESGPDIRLVVNTTPRDEASFVAMELDSLHRDERIPWDDLGILVRTNGQSRELEEALRMAGIPFQVVGGTAFFERREVKDVLAYLRLLVNRRDEIALRRAIATPSRGIGATTLSRLSAWGALHIEPLFEALKAADRVPGVAPRMAREAKRFAGIIDSLAAEMAGTRDLAGVVERMLTEVGMRQSILLGEGGRKQSAARFYLDNIHSLINTLRDYQQKVQDPDLVDYLRRITLDSGEREKGGDQRDTGRVTLMTLHASKGLEFQAVFLVGVEEGLLPHLRSTEERGGDDSEERRLFYVGVTRARRHLTMTRCLVRSRFDGEYRPDPSRFLDDLPAGLYTTQDRTGGAPPTQKEAVASGFARLLDALK